MDEGYRVTLRCFSALSNVDLIIWFRRTKLFVNPLFQIVNGFSFHLHSYPRLVPLLSDRRELVCGSISDALILLEQVYKPIPVLGRLSPWLTCPPGLMPRRTWGCRHSSHVPSVKPLQQVLRGLSWLGEHAKKLIAHPLTCCSEMMMNPTCIQAHSACSAFSDLGLAKAD